MSEPEVAVVPATEQPSAAANVVAAATDDATAYLAENRVWAQNYVRTDDKLADGDTAQFGAFDGAGPHQLTFSSDRNCCKADTYDFQKAGQPLFTGETTAMNWAGGSTACAAQYGNGPVYRNWFEMVGWTNFFHRNWDVQTLGKEKVFSFEIVPGFLADLSKHIVKDQNGQEIGRILQPTMSQRVIDMWREQMFVVVNVVDSKGYTRWTLRRHGTCGKPKCGPQTACTPEMQLKFSKMCYGRWNIDLNELGCDCDFSNCEIGFDWLKCCDRCEALCATLCDCKMCDCDLCGYQIDCSRCSDCDRCCDCGPICGPEPCFRCVTCKDCCFEVCPKLSCFNSIGGLCCECDWKWRHCCSLCGADQIKCPVHCCCQLCQPKCQPGDCCGCECMDCKPCCTPVCDCLAVCCTCQCYKTCQFKCCKPNIKCCKFTGCGCGPCYGRCGVQYGKCYGLYKANYAKCGVCIGINYRECYRCCKKEECPSYDECALKVKCSNCYSKCKPQCLRECEELKLCCIATCNCIKLCIVKCPHRYKQIFCGGREVRIELDVYGPDGDDNVPVCKVTYTGVSGWCCNGGASLRGKYVCTIDVPSVSPYYARYRNQQRGVDYVDLALLTSLAMWYDFYTISPREHFQCMDAPVLTGDDLCPTDEYFQYHEKYLVPNFPPPRAVSEMELIQRWVFGDGAAAVGGATGGVKGDAGLSAGAGLDMSAGAIGFDFQKAGYGITWGRPKGAIATSAPAASPTGTVESPVVVEASASPQPDAVKIHVANP